jgi:hypothetical protein
MDEAKIRAVVEAAVRDAATLGKKVIPEVIDAIMFQVREHAADEYQRGHSQGMNDEREAHFG